MGLPVQPRHWGKAGPQDAVSRIEVPFPQDKVHWLGSPFGLCMDGAKGIDTELLYNTPDLMQVNGWQRESLNHVWAGPSA